MKPLTLHVGPHKTGTTSIQFHLHSNRQELADQGVAYPSFPPPLPCCHNQLALAFADGDGGKYLSIALEDIARSPRAIMSGEEFSVPQRPGLRAGLEFLESKFAVNYVFVHRDPVERLVSYVIHSAASGSLDISTPDGAAEHLMDGYRFGLQQRQFFVDRGATVIDYAELNIRGVEWFAEEVFGVKLPPAKSRLNSSDGHSETLLSMPTDRRMLLANWLSSEPVRDVLLAGVKEEGRPALTSAIKARVYEIIEAASLS